MQDLLGGADVSCGPLTFSDFSYSGTAGIPAPDMVNVTCWSPGGDIYGLCFGGTFGTSLGGSEDVQLSYTVTAPSAIIQSLHVLLVGGVLGPDGAITVFEKGVTTPGPSMIVAESTAGFLKAGGNIFVNDMSDPPDEPGDVTSFAPMSALRIYKDIMYTAGATSATDVTLIYQGFDVPEPHEYALLAGLGLIGFAAYRRMRV